MKIYQAHAFLLNANINQAFSIYLLIYLSKIFRYTYRLW